MESNIKTENSKNIKKLLEILCEDIQELKDYNSKYESDPRKNASITLSDLFGKFINIPQGKQFKSAMLQVVKKELENKLKLRDNLQTLLKQLINDLRIVMKNRGLEEYIGQDIETEVKDKREKVSKPIIPPIQTKIDHNVMKVNFLSLVFNGFLGGRQRQTNDNDSQKRNQVNSSELKNGNCQYYGQILPGMTKPIGMSKK